MSVAIILAATMLGQLVDESTRQGYVDSLPVIEDKEIDVLLRGRDVIWYTEDEMPRAYQDWEGALRGVHWAWNNVSANRGEPYGNGNREYPWAHPGGAIFGTNVLADRSLPHALILPEREEGGKWPVVWWNVRRGSQYAGIRWLFPKGAVLVELLGISHDGYQYVVEIRMRTREIDGWTTEVLKPFRSEEEYLAAIRSRGREVSSYRPSEQKLFTVSSRHPNPPIKSMSRKIPVLPAIEPSLASDLLRTTPFRASLGYDWFPTTASSFHVVPKVNRSFVTGSSSQDCMNCHRHTNVHVGNFDRPRDWYGRIRGSDGIFSFHPFDRSCISIRGTPQGMRINQRLVSAGIVSGYDPQRHPNDVYRQIPGLK